MSACSSSKMFTMRKSSGWKTVMVPWSSISIDGEMAAFYNPVLIITASLFWKGFLHDFGLCLWEFVPIQSKGHLCGQALILNEKSWLAIDFQFIPKVFSGVEVNTRCRLLGFLHTKFIKPCVYGPHFVHRGTVMMGQERTFSKLLPQVWKHTVV